MAIIAIIIVVALAFGAFYIFTHQGQSTTVHNPSVHAPSVTGLQDQVLHFITTPTGGTLVAAAIIGTLILGIWKKLGKGTLVLLAVLVFGVIAFVVGKH